MKSNFQGSLAIAAMVLLQGCTSTQSDLTSTEVADANSQFVFLTGTQIRERLIGNTLTGTSNNFPQAGPITFWVHYGPDGTAKDRLRFVRNGRVDRSTGIWRIADEDNGIFCSTFAKRRNGIEVCSRIQVADSKFRSLPIDSSIKGAEGEIVSGNQAE